MKLLGIGSAYHDLNYCIFENDKILVHNELERFTRFKHDFRFDKLFELINLQNHWESYDHVVYTLHYGWEPGINYPSFLKNIENKTGVGHHTCHAANAFYNSNFDRALIFTFDGGGFEPISYWTTSCIYTGEDNKLENIYKNYSFDIGGTWHSFLSLLGMDDGSYKGDGVLPNGDESGTLMAMASYGDYKKYLELFDNIFIIKRMSKLWDQKSQHFKKLALENEQNKFDLAASLQYVTEEFIKSYILSHINLNGNYKNICFSGGVSLNCVALGKISKLLKTMGFNVFCDPTPSDNGLSIGAVKYYYYHILNNKRTTEIHNCYFGKTYTYTEVSDEIKKYDNLNIQTDIELDKIVELLMSGKIISVFNEGSESGKRALGNRSIIADPRFAFMKDFINEKVKHRKSFRPFAPSVLREEVSNWFDYDIDSPYMSFAVEVKEEKRHLVPAILHKDNTARLQTVTQKDNGYYYDLIKLFFNKTGVPMLLNTSFNDREPIVETPEHAINCFIRTKIDYLYFVKEKMLVNK